MRPRDLGRAIATGLCLSLGIAGAFLGCSGWDPRSPFEHNAPEVDEALKQLDSGRMQPAEDTLEKYLSTGPCSAEAGIALPPSIRQKSNGAFDLGLTLFALGEQFGQRFGDEERSDGGSPQEQALAQKRGLEIDCALLIARAIAADPGAPAELRARAYYLAGNLEFLRKKYEEAVKEYDQALGLVPGLHGEGGVDTVGRDAAWNRAIALRRIEDHKDAGNDAGPDGSDASDGSDAADGSDGSDGSSGKDGGDDGGKDGGGNDKDAGNDAGKDGGDKNDGGNDAGNEDGGAQPEPQPPQPASSSSATPQQDQRLLDQLEQAPSYQGQEAKQRANVRRGRSTMEDK